MSRTLSSNGSINTEIQNKLDDSSMMPAYFLHISGISGEDDIWISTMNRDYTMNVEGTNRTFIGAGDVLSISQIQEPSDLQSNGITISLNGLDSTILDMALNVDYQNGKLRLGFAVLKTALVDTPPYPIRYQNEFPTVLFNGRIDQMVIQDTGTSCAMEISIENRLASFERADHLRFTDADQRGRGGKNNDGSTGNLVDVDVSFKHVPVIQKRVLKWKASS